MSVKTAVKQPVVESVVVDNININDQIKSKNDSELVELNKSAILTQIFENIGTFVDGIDYIYLYNLYKICMFSS